MERESHEGIFPELPFNFRRPAGVEQTWAYPAQVRNVARRLGYPFNDGLVGRVPFQWRRLEYFPGAMSRYLGCRVTPYDGFLPLLRPQAFFPPGHIQTDAPDLELSRAHLAFAAMGW